MSFKALYGRLQAVGILRQLRMGRSLPSNIGGKVGECAYHIGPLLEMTLDLDDFWIKYQRSKLLVGGVSFGFIFCCIEQDTF